MGEPLLPELFLKLNPQVAIASAHAVDSETVAQLQQRQIQFFWTQENGALQWSPLRSFQPTLGTNDIDPTDF